MKSPMATMPVWLFRMAYIRRLPRWGSVVDAVSSSPLVRYSGKRHFVHKDERHTANRGYKE